MAHGIADAEVGGATGVEPRGSAVAEARAPIIAVDGLHLSYALPDRGARNVLDGISLVVEPGEFVVLLGQTGCGKSSLLRLLLGQERPTGGSIEVAGRAVTRVDARSGYVPQRYSLFPNRTVLGNLMIGPEMSRFHLLQRYSPAFRRFQKEVRAEALLQLRHLGLHESDAGKYPHQLSGGMQQRVAIAQALMMRPRVLLMDEAFSALDPATRRNLQHLLKDLWKEQQTTVVFVTHNTAEALFLGTRVIVLARRGPEDNQGARVALDLRLPADGITATGDPERFQMLAQQIEGASMMQSAPGDTGQ